MASTVIANGWRGPGRAKTGGGNQGATHCRGAAKPKHTKSQPAKTRTRGEWGALPALQTTAKKPQATYVTADKGLNKLSSCRGSRSELCASRIVNPPAVGIHRECSSNILEAARLRGTHQQHGRRR